MQAKITCPCCSNSIYIESELLLTGASFYCVTPNCGSVISLGAPSTEILNKAFLEFNKVKQLSQI